VPSRHRRRPDREPVCEQQETDRGSLVVGGALDDEDGFRRPAEQLHQALSRRAPERTALAQIPRMEHALAEEAGLEPAPQTARAARVNAAVVADWAVTERPATFCAANGLRNGRNWKEDLMPRAYWINTFRSVSDPDSLTAYIELAGPAMRQAGGRFLARGQPARVFERGVMERTVVIEFESVEHAVAAYESPAYQEALRALGDGAERDLRIIEAAS
jgi:uncharacterized protein (DUF1330 family)